MIGPTLRERIEGDRIHLLDGAMGTELYDRGVFLNICYDDLVRTRPDLVRSIHTEYVLAGAELIETNSFGANPVKLSGHGLEEDTEEINRAAAQLAREAVSETSRTQPSGAPTHVLGAIGPLGIRIEPWGPTSVEEAEAHFRRQIEGLVDGGVDGFCLETFADLTEIGAACGAIRALSDAPIFAHVTVDESLHTAYGAELSQCTDTLAALGVDVLGLNCSVGPATLLEGIEEMASQTHLPLSAQPNAGLPRTVQGRTMYVASPDYMAQYTRRLIEAGARFVGGCCGTTPTHTSGMAATVRSLQPRHEGGRVTVIVDSDRATSAKGETPVPVEERSSLGAKISTRQWVSSVELLPPRGWDVTELLASVRALDAAGVDVVSFVDSARGGRMGAIAAGLRAIEALGKNDGSGSSRPDVLVHYTCRDRNMMSMVADLLGASAGGVRNLLLVTGDPPTQGPYVDSTAVFDIDSIGLTNVVDGLNHGRDPGGGSIGVPTRFVVGVAANPGAADLDREIERFAWKAEAGADFAVTQPVFDLDALDAFLDGTRSHPLPILAGIWPLTSLRNVEFLANEVPGVVVPEHVIDRMAAAHEGGPAAARSEGIAIAREVVDALGSVERVMGTAVTASGGDVDAAIEVLR